MAKQDGVYKFSGKFGDMVGYIQEGKNYVKSAPKKYEQSEGTKQSSAEFGTANKEASEIRKAFNSVLPASIKKDKRNRLSGRLLEIIRSGPAHKKGERRVFDGSLSTLKGFEFNEHTQLTSLMHVVPKVEVTEGCVEVEIPEGDAEKCFRWPGKYDILVLTVACAFVDFDNPGFKTATYELRLEKKAFAAIKVSIPIPGQEEVAALVMLTICFEKDRLPGSSSTTNRKQHAAQVAEAFHLRNGEVHLFVPEQTAVPEVKQVERRDPTIKWDEG